MTYSPRTSHREGTNAEDSIGAESMALDYLRRAVCVLEESLENNRRYRGALSRRRQSAQSA